MISLNVRSLFHSSVERWEAGSAEGASACLYPAPAGQGAAVTFPSAGPYSALSGRNAVCWERLAGPGPSLGGEGAPRASHTYQEMLGDGSPELLGTWETGILPCSLTCRKGWQAVALSKDSKQLETSCLTWKNYKTNPEEHWLSHKEATIHMKSYKMSNWSQLRTGQFGNHWSESQGLA